MNDSSQPEPETTATFHINAAAVRTGLLVMILLVVGFSAGVMLTNSRSISRAEVEAMLIAMPSGQMRDASTLPSASLIDNDPSFGSQDAPVTIVEFSDFYCPACMSHATNTLPLLRAQYGDKIHYVYRDMPIISGQAGVDGAIAGNCAFDQGKFWELHDLLYSNNAARERDTYIAFADEIGMDTDAFAACLDDPKNVDEITLDYIDGQGRGVVSIPRFFINGAVVVGAHPFETFALVIDRELERAGAETTAR